MNATALNRLSAASLPVLTETDIHGGGATDDHPAGHSAVVRLHSTASSDALDDPPWVSPVPSAAAVSNSEQKHAPVLLVPGDIRIKALFDNATSVQGDVTARHGIKVSGSLVGNLVVPPSADGRHGDIIIDKDSVVEGIVIGYRVFNFGRIDGVVVAKELLTLGPDSVVTQGALYAKWNCFEGSEIGGKVSKLAGDHPADSAIEKFIAEVKAQTGA